MLTVPIRGRYHKVYQRIQSDRFETDSGESGYILRRGYSRIFDEMNANKLCDILPSIPPPHSQSIHFHGIAQLLLWRRYAALRINSFAEYGALLQPFLPTQKLVLSQKRSPRRQSKSAQCIQGGVKSESTACNIHYRSLRSRDKTSEIRVF